MIYSILLIFLEEMELWSPFTCPIRKGREDRVSADSIRDRMVQSQEERGFVAGEIDGDDLPEGASAIERPLVDGPYGTKELVQASADLDIRAQRIVAEVVGWIESGVELPSRQGQAEGSIDDPLAQARHRAGRMQRRHSETLRLRSSV